MSSPWVVSDRFCVIGSELFSLGRSWCFLRHEIIIFLLEVFHVFVILKVMVRGSLV